MPAMRVLVVDESAERAEMLRAALLLAGYEVTASLTSPLTLLNTIERLQPDDRHRLRSIAALRSAA